MSSCRSRIDPFLGSGSTLIAAEQTGRTCRGIELDPLYVDLVVARYEKTFGRQAVLEETGERFAEVAERRLAGLDVGQSPSVGAPPDASVAEETGR